MIKRILCNLALIVSLLFFPWWVTVGIVFTCLVFVGSFYEVIIYALLTEVLYGGSPVSALPTGTLVIVSVVLVCVSAWGRSFLRVS